MPTVFGFAGLLLILLFTVQVVFDLYARSVVTAAAVRAARSAASFRAATPDAAVADAEASLGGYAREARFTWEPAPPGQVWLRVRFDLRRSPLELSRWALPFLDSFDRTVKVRAEHVVCDRTPCAPLGGT